MPPPDPVHSPAPCRPPPAALPAVMAGAPPLEWREGGGWHERRRLERLVRRCFAIEHGARITHFLPRLFGLWQGRIPLAAIGVGLASEGSLFQEHYLDSSAEHFLSRRLGRPVAREAIAEIGNLASLRRGLQRRLFVQLIDQLVAEGLDWVMFTATPTVANGIQRLGIELHPLQLADPARLGEEQACWGRYYEHHPRVMAGDLRLAHGVLTERRLLDPRRTQEAGHVPLR
ncbi:MULTISPECIES: thermostable hemolysin [unclassified Halomonas]|uniref:thermostable hemolysin n=1 Tax=unclassified Halomonas TaxID=2609666 RepID=UPI0024699481|nr:MULTISPECIES: thermostable hemolysin [unclassified Halomonas]